MREEMLKIGIDYDDLLSRLANHEQLALKLLKKFLNDETINTIKQAYLNQDYDLLLKSVHTLKGVSGNLAMKSLFCITKNWLMIYVKKIMLQQMNFINNVSKNMILFIMV